MGFRRSFAEFAKFENLIEYYQQINTLDLQLD